MDVGSITMDRAAAEAAYREYSASVRGRMLDEYREVRAAYNELRKGHAIIDINRAFEIAGLDERKRPRIAIVRADQPKVYFDSVWFNDWHGLVFSHKRRIQGNYTNGVVRVPNGTWSEARSSLQAVTPIVPPRFLPRDSLENYYIIFEPVWSAVPHPDPILCKRINVTTFAAVAQWDMTPVELMVLRGRLA